MKQWTDEVRLKIDQNEKVLIGIGLEWEKFTPLERQKAYQRLEYLIAGKDYFIITMLTDGLIFKSELDSERIVAPCGNVRWYQCPDACTRDIWESGETKEDCCPHCGKLLIENIVQTDNYIEEGYLPQWIRYTDWLSHTLNKGLTLLELGVNFDMPTVIRWPFEKTTFFNKKSYLFRIHKELYQISEEIKGNAVGIKSNSLDFLLEL